MPGVFVRGVEQEGFFIGFGRFFWGLVKFIFAAGNEESKADGKKIMIWGVVALFVMVSVWGLVRFIAETFDVSQNSSVDVPTVKGL